MAAFRCIRYMMHQAANGHLAPHGPAGTWTRRPASEFFFFKGGRDILALDAVRRLQPGDKCLVSQKLRLVPDASLR